ncbi:MAG TPA: efflux RND transporter periplasmic adaptor subunit [Gemmatimonadaceae bacterium]
MRRRAPTWSGSACLTLIASFTLVAACAKKDAGDAEVKPVVNAQTIVIAPSGFTETLGAIGNVVARAGHIATLSAPAQGHVAEVMATTGQKVRRGQVVVELDRAPFDAALHSAQTALEAAEKANERQQRLANEGIVPRKDAETAAADLAKARADEVGARRVAELATLRAPIDGIVTKMNATLGASVDPSQPLVEISDPSALDVLMNVTPSEAARVLPGAKVTLSAGQSASGEPLGIGSVMDVSGTVDSTSRGVAVRVQAPTTRRALRIGETVFGAITVGVRPSAIVIPTEALVPEGDAFKVFVVDNGNIAHERDVKVGAKNTSGVEITQGLKAGEKIVTTGAYAMQDSAKVAPLNALPDTSKDEGDDKKVGEKPDDTNGDSAKAVEVKSDAKAPVAPAKPAKAPVAKGPAKAAKP